MKVLNITLKRQWFDLIKAGIKTEEYRMIKPYWIVRLSKTLIYQPSIEQLLQHNSFKTFDLVSANNGYAKNCPNITWRHKGIRIGTGNPEWGAEPGKQYFILEIGEIISHANM